MKGITLHPGDIFGGITAGIVALPLALAFGVQSGLGAAAGLYGAIAVGILAAFFGGTATQISGPTGPMTVVSAAVIASLIALKGDLASALPSILLCFMLAGFFQILLGLTGAGKYIKYIPYPVVSGFMTGIGVIIIVLQLFPMLGHISPGNIIDIFKNLGTPLSDINFYALLLAALSIAIIYLFPKITKAIPSVLVALIIVSLIPIFIPMDVRIIGDIPSGLPAIRLELFSAFGRLDMIILSALTLAALGTIDSLLTSVVADNITRTTHNSNKELIGQGIGNMGSALIGGIPGAGATMRTLVNIRAGGKSKVSGVIHGLVLLLILLGLGKFASQIPLPVLSGILITVGIGIIDTRGIKHLRKVTRVDAVVMIIVLVLTVFVDLLQAVAAGMIISSVLFMKRVGDISQEQSVSTIDGDEEVSGALHDAYAIPEEIQKYVSIKQINGPLFFGNNDYFHVLSQQISSTSKVLLIDMRLVPYIDQSGLYTMENIVLHLEQKKIQVFLLGLQTQPKDMMKNINLIPDLVDEGSIHTDPVASVAAITAYINEKLKSGKD
ncbi:MAG TPA: SulP family inorganic anion transporter [Saprospiraceae bacterium]|nr:SulP family inorganic anion transporter [Saprospiraceae bacterium]